uniref:Uncharacterized protein n=1 Tax=Oryza punctata TaxID=4537 RepID=A0A0E0KVT7_ORYPU
MPLAPTHHYESGGCPYIHFRLYEDYQRMACSYVQMINDIKRDVNHLSAEQNGGVVPFIGAGLIFPAVGEAYYKYKTPVLASAPNHNLHFVVLLHSPPVGPREPPVGNKAEPPQNSCQHIGGRPFPGAPDPDYHGYGPTLQPWEMPWPSLVPNTRTRRIFTATFDDATSGTGTCTASLLGQAHNTSLQVREGSTITRASSPSWGRVFGVFVFRDLFLVHVTSDV